MAVRRRLARWQRARTAGVWPILPGSEQPPNGWTGWPHGKQFALVLTHDVETRGGLARCRDIMRLEMRLGLRSSFNFVPEGNYRVPTQLREELVSNGFEVGVHDFHHDGHLFASRREFGRKAAHINYYLHEWRAVGFRSGFMLHKLDWLHDLDIAYDASTFDTDPFEPQPEGRHTIFPFWVSSEGNGVEGHPRPGYVELPYTLPQDSTVFILLGERSPEIWMRKLDWIAERGGMALLDTHPDYLCFDGKPRVAQFDASLYREFLDYAVKRYGQVFWNALPRDVAEYARLSLQPQPRRRSKPAATALSSTPPVKIWIDLDNTPHVPFFIPIIRELKNRGHRVVVTARDAFQVCELADRKGLQCVKVGRHYGKNPFMKIFGVLWRAAQLLPFHLREKPQIALSHGARSQILLTNLFLKPTILISDYEFSQTPLLMTPRWEIVPDSIPTKGLHSDERRVRKYAGIKEDVYAPDFRPESGLLQELGLDDTQIIVTVRPPANEAHYHNPESELLLAELMTRICANDQVRAIMLPRNQQQETLLRNRHPEWFANNKTIVPARAVDGLNLLWHSDLVVSGGGTMNREAAALGVPVYSIFRGKTGAVDRRLEQQGRLIMVRNSAEVQRKIVFQRREKNRQPDIQPRGALHQIVDHVEDIIRAEYNNGGSNPARRNGAAV
jgi:predicted glycosyltransferase